MQTGRFVHPPNVVIEVPSLSLRSTQVFPTGGTRSTSLWDAPNAEGLQNYLDEVLPAECNSEVFQVRLRPVQGGLHGDKAALCWWSHSFIVLQVQEDFAYGISAELTRIRATERVRLGCGLTVYGPLSAQRKRIRFCR